MVSFAAVQGLPRNKETVATTPDLCRLRRAPHPGEPGRARRGGGPRGPGPVLGAVMTRTDAMRLARRVAAHRRRGFPPAVVLVDVYDNVPADDPERCPRITLVNQLGSQWYAGCVQGEREYAELLLTAWHFAAGMSAN